MLPIAVHSVTKAYRDGEPVLSDVTLDVGAGEMFFLLGASGCGKTTMLRLIAGFLTPDAGSISFGDRDVTHEPAETRDIGMVFQNYALWPHLTVGENVVFGLDVRKVASVDKRRRVEEALALVELPGYGNRRISELSGGQQQRVALARAIIVRPQVLLLDEPLSNLDARLRVTMRSEIRRVCKASGLTAVYVTHDQSEALSTADRIALLHHGTVAQVGTPRDLYERPASRAVAEFVGEANLIPASVVDRTSVNSAFGTLASARIPERCPPGSTVTVCIRPERLRVVTGSNASANRIDGAIVSGSYLGGSGQWRVSVPAGKGLELMVSETCPQSRNPGDALSLAVPPDDVIVLAT
ncbi:MAG: ABC transporter ATP-binding protein [Planctomycetes bacterium]|nr:ABC transporter ATP-binding protein [Planctomycetota bacterium]